MPRAEKVMAKQRISDVAFETMGAARRAGTRGLLIGKSATGRERTPA